MSRQLECTWDWIKNEIQGAPEKRLIVKQLECT